MTKKKKGGSDGNFKYRTGHISAVNSPVMILPGYRGPANQKHLARQIAGRYISQGSLPDVIFT
jgi:hypothetical protein